MLSAAEFERLLEGMIERLRVEYAPREIILFGSYAEGSQTEGSDIDLFIVKETAERFIDRWTSVRSILSDPARAVGIDTLILTPREIEERVARGDQFITGILEKGKVLYAA